MKRALTIFAVLSLLFVSAVAFAKYVGEGEDFDLKHTLPRTTAQPHAEEPPQALDAPEPRVELVPDPDETLPVDEDLALWARTAMEEWAPKPTKWCTQRGCTKDSTELRFGFSEDVSAVVADEPAIFANDATKTLTTAHVLSVAHHEGTYLAWVNDGSCNDDAWRARAWTNGTTWAKDVCDNGHAWTLFQLHNEGYAIYGAPSWDWAHLDMAKAKHGGELGLYGHVVLGPEMIAHRRRAVRVALHRLRTSVPTLCGYTGEPGPCPKGHQRAEFARKYAETHPLKP